MAYFHIWTGVLVLKRARLCTFPHSHTHHGRGRTHICRRIQGPAHDFGDPEPRIDCPREADVTRCNGTPRPHGGHRHCTSAGPNVVRVWQNQDDCGQPVRPLQRQLQQRLHRRSQNYLVRDFLAAMRAWEDHEQRAHERDGKKRVVYSPG